MYLLALVGSFHYMCLIHLVGRTVDCTRKLYCFINSVWWSCIM